jgi:hypothetical protein
MSELLRVHLDAVLSVIQARSTHWLIYPVTIVKAASCCDEESRAIVHREDLIRLATRIGPNRRLAGHVPIPRDLSMRKESSLYATLGSAIYFQWEGARPQGIAELDTVLILEYSLLQYMRLQILEEQVSRLTFRERTLRRRYSSAIKLFSELRQKDVRAGEARAIVKHLLDELGAPQMQHTIETALTRSASAHATSSSSRSARRTWWISLAATAVAFLVAAAPVRALLSSVPDEDPSEQWPLALLRWMRDQGFWGPWILLAIVGGGLLAMWLAFAVLRSLPWQFPSFRRGFKWPTEFSVARTGESPSSKEPTATTLSVTFIKH